MVASRSCCQRSPWSARSGGPCPRASTGHEAALAAGASTHVARCLGQALLEGRSQSTLPTVALDHEPLPACRLGHRMNEPTRSRPRHRQGGRHDSASHNRRPLPPQAYRTGDEGDGEQPPRSRHESCQHVSSQVPFATVWRGARSTNSRVEEKRPATSFTSRSMAAVGTDD